MRVLVPAVLAAAVALSIDVHAAQPEFLIRPYLFTLKGKEIALAWAYREGMEPQDGTRVRLIYPDLKTEHLTAHQDRELRYAVLPIPGCGFGEGVRYHVSGMDEPATITNIPCASEEEAVRFSFLADTQMGPKIAARVAERIRAFAPAAVLHGGDIVQLGSRESDWIGYFRAMEPVGGEKVLFPAIGNHEYFTDPGASNWQHYLRVPGYEAHYAFDLGPAHVMVINSCFEDDARLIGSQIEWLRAELAVPARWKIVVFHHAPYSSDFMHSPLWPLKEHKDLQKYYVPLFEEHQVDLVLNGHTHVYEHSYKSGVHYLTAGPAGGIRGLYGAINPYRIQSNRWHHTVTQLEVSPTRLRAITENVKGKIIDAFDLLK